MKKLILLILIFTIVQIGKAQQNYCDFEGLKSIRFGFATGQLDTFSLNPAPNLVDSSANCGKYIRSTTLYDNFKIHPYNLLTDINSYANDSLQSPKIQMKIYSSAPAGTSVILQLGTKNDDTYPSGIHSEYIAMTTMKNAWEQLIFDYLQSPTGSLTTSTNIDKIVVLFHPASASRDTIYFDDLTGPSLMAPINVPQLENLPAFKLYQNIPNPVKENTQINFQLNSSGYISLELYDLLGQPVRSLINQNMKTGTYSIPVETSTIPDGIYFYILKRDNFSKTMKMIVLK
ncbi:MAG: T9SS type A sorting domain-containing protein [Bacteroidetes bacterium]|nr:T9SS type A sorting domain-containing protein [Bacteroidota bacterium]